MRRLLLPVVFAAVMMTAALAVAQEEPVCNEHYVEDVIVIARDLLDEAEAAATTDEALSALYLLRLELSDLLAICDDDYQPAFGIDYVHPEQYLAQGEQSQISDPTVLDGLRAEEQSLAQLGDIYRWLKSEFTRYAAGGRTVGVVTVDQLLAERRLGGCHDHALVYAAVARELGYPALMVRTVSIAWVEQFQAAEQGPHVGHAFVEVYLDGKWVLIDSTNGWYVENDYDPTDPVIPLRGHIAGSSDEIYGFYVERKGIDTWDFGIHSPTESTQAMDDLARQFNLEAIVYPEYTFQRFER